MQKLLVCTFGSLLFSVRCISLAQLLSTSSVMLSIYATLSSHLLAVQVRENGSKPARDCVHLGKIENSSYRPSRTCITSNTRAYSSIKVV